ncbi:hypothetical protein E4T38_02657 [Aureobasidium subglaciale]|nr:hypothetical protein E4T38_02657 [Aureobasidium subglaciale]KAI5227618.1 hypothetical protein E4T40_02518 [Aureobasidium subglaciale]KAI5230994.1 hypothetical protein E4T41_02656 [Aureobasidium subglaciale]KAI5265202.1 hypothetical protein E4T46_02434 [Aureobasidium subglaciale]
MSRSLPACQTETEVSLDLIGLPRHMIQRDVLLISLAISIFAGIAQRNQDDAKPQSIVGLNSFATLARALFRSVRVIGLGIRRSRVTQQDAISYTFKRRVPSPEHIACTVYNVC